MTKFHLPILLISAIYSYCIQVSLATEKQIQQPEIRSGVFFTPMPYVSQPDLNIAMKFWANELSKQVDFSSHTTIYTNIKTMQDDFDKGIINFIVAKPLTILQEFDISKLTQGYKAKWSGLTADNLLVITHKESGITNFSLVKNKHLSLLINDPISEIFVDTLALESFSAISKQVFNQVEFLSKSNQLILNLFFKKTDVILVYEGVYNLAVELNPQIKVNTQVIARHPNIPRSLSFFHPSIDPIFREHVLTEIENLKTVPEGQQLLELFRADSLVRSEIKDLDSVRELLKRYQSLSNKKGRLK